MIPSRLIALCGVVFVLAAVASTGGVGGADGIIVAASDNETILHEHPDEVGADGDLDAVEGWLSGRMGEVHIDCAEGVVVGDYDVCDRLDDDYPDFLSRYATVERDTDGDDETTRTFERTRDTQREFADDDEEFWNTYEEYENARESGDDERRRQAARDLLEIAAGMDQRSDTLISLFSQLETQTGVEYGEATDAVERSNENVQETTETIATDEFSPTAISAERNATDASFYDPVGLSGEVVDTEGNETVSDGQIAVVVDDRRVGTTPVGDDGRYDVQYRPTVTPIGETNVTVAYEPAEQSPYLGSEATTEVAVQQSEVALELLTVSDSVAYGEPIRVTGRVGGDHAAAGVSVSGALDSVQFSGVRTDTDGTFELSTRLSADVPDGERTIEVRASESGLALSPVDAQSTVTVDETETDLSVTGNYDGGTIRVDGHLVTVDGTPVADQSITGYVDGAEQTVATTDADGRYSMEIDGAESDADAWNLSAVYSGSETNLGTSRSETTVRVPDETASGLQGAVGLVGGLVETGTEALSELTSLVIDRPIASLAIALVAIGLLAVVFHILRTLLARPTARDAIDRLWNALSSIAILGRLSSRFRDETRSVDATAASATDTVSSSVRKPEVRRTEQLLDIAQKHLQDGFPTEAVTIGYASVRAHFQSDDPNGVATPEQTHREFYHELADALSDEQVAALRTVTDVYEQAAFAPVDIDESTAEDTLRAVRRCVDNSL